MKKEKKGKKKSKALVIILGIFLTFVVIMGVREINRFIHVGKITKIDSEEKEIGCPAVMSFVYSDLFYKYELGDGCTYYVYYKDGSKESLSKALYLHHLSVNDLEKFDFSLMRRKLFSSNYQNAETVGKKYDYSKDDDVYIVSKIEDNNSSDNCLDMIDVFYSDNKYDYSFNCINNNIIVTYANGKTEEIHEAFQNKHVTIKDLDKFNISYQKLERQVTVKAINSGVSNNGCNLEKTIIYSDNTYNYYIKNTCYTVVFSDGSKEPIEEAFKNNKISIKDLDNLNFNYTKEAK